MRETTYDPLIPTPTGGWTPSPDMIARASKGVEGRAPVVLDLGGRFIWAGMRSVISPGQVSIKGKRYAIKWVRHVFDGATVLVALADASFQNHGAPHSDPSGVTFGMAALKSEMAALKSEMAALKSEMAVLRKLV